MSDEPDPLPDSLQATHDWKLPEGAAWTGTGAVGVCETGVLTC